MMIGMSGLGGFGVLFVYACDIRMGGEAVLVQGVGVRGLEAMTDRVGRLY